MPANTSALSEAQREQFRRDGLLIVPGFYDAHADVDVEPVQWAVQDVLGQLMTCHSVADEHPLFEVAQFGTEYQALIARHLAWGGEANDTAKHLPTFLRLVEPSPHEPLMRELRPGCVPDIAGEGYSIRIDNQCKDCHHSEWQQDYPHHLRSLDGLVFSSSSVSVTSDLSPMRFYPGVKSRVPATGAPETPERHHPQRCL